MEVRIDISPAYPEPLAEIHTARVTDEVKAAAELLGADSQSVTAQDGSRIVILKPEEIYMIRVEGGDAVLYGKSRSYYSRKRLYELSRQLGKRFMQISKSTLVNLSYLDSVEAGFNGTLLLKLKNGSQDYVSRRYLPEFKRYLGL